MVCCQEAQYELLLNKYQRFNSEPNVCQRLARMWGSGCVEQKVTPEKKKCCNTLWKLHFIFNTILNLWVLPEKQKQNVLS